MSKSAYLLLVFLAACSHRDPQPVSHNVEPSKPNRISGKYFIDYTYSNENGKFKFDQFVEFHSDGTCTLLENFCEGLGERKDRYFLSNNKITFAESDYVLIVKNQEEIVFQENISGFTCGNVENKAILIKRR
jgi:hypothetical protein